MPVAPAITTHSIIAVNNLDAPKEKWTDGVGVVGRVFIDTLCHAVATLPWIYREGAGQRPFFSTRLAVAFAVCQRRVDPFLPD